MKELIHAFLKLGFTAFGGPAAHISMMENEFVHRRKWLSREEFLDLLGAASLIPGPSSTEMAIFIGYRRAGWRGLLVAGLCFILPAALIVTAIAWAYARYNTLPAATSVLYGIKPVIVAVILQAVWTLGRTAVKNRSLAIVGSFAAGASAVGMSIPLLLLLAGVISAAAWAIRERRHSPQRMTMLLLTLCGVSLGRTALASQAIASKIPVTLTRLFLFFAKVGSIQFGSGYVLLAFLRTDLVERWRWLSEGQLLDAAAVGQFTPGPVFTTATFIGYLLRGPWGAVVATIGIFFPAFLLVAASGAFIPQLRKSKFAGAFLDGVNVASLGLMALVAWQLGRASITDIPTVALALISALTLIRFRLNSAWLICFGGLAGFLLQQLHG